MMSADAKPEMVVVRVFGTPEIRVGDQRIGLSSEGLFALALYLTTRAGERIPRTEVLDIFWPRDSVESPRHAMGQMLYRTRRCGIHLIESTDAIGMDRLMVDSDISRVLQVDWPELAAPSEVEGALSYNLTFSTRMPPAFRAWHEELQAILGQRARRAATRLMSQSRNEGRWGTVEKWASAILSSDSLNEEATLALAEAVVMLGSKEQALEILDVYIDELGDDAEARGRPAHAMRRRLAERRMGWTQRGTKEVSLVGREQAMARLTHVLTPESGAACRSVLLLGPSGFGKTRLLHEARDFAALRGIRTIELRADAAETSQPWALVRALVRGLLDSPGSVAVSPQIMATARALARPEAGSGGALSIAPEMTATDILGCVMPLFTAVSDESRLLVTLDDLHRSDAYSISIIGKAMAELGPTRCSVIAAARPGVLSHLVLAEGTNGVHVVRLASLSTAECRQLAQSTAAAHNIALSDTELDSIAHRAGGHPHFARELALSRTRGTSFDSLPMSLSSIVDSTLSHQSPDALRLLRVAALLGDAATTARVQQASALPPHALCGCLESLADDAIIHLDNDRNVRIHDSWRDAILASMPDVTAAALALECAAALSDDARRGDFKVNRRLAALYWTAGEFSKATQLNLASIDSLLSSGLYSAAVDSVGSLGSTITDAPSRVRLRAREALALLGSGRPSEALAIADDVWRSRSLHSAPFLSEHLLAVGVSADAHVRLNRADEGPADELVLLAHSDALIDPDRARACLIGVRLTGNVLSIDQFREFERASEGLALQLPSSPMVALTRLIAAAELKSATDIIEAQKLVNQIDQGALSVGDRCLLLRCSANALRIAGRTDDAASTAIAAVRLAEDHSMGYAASTASELTGSILLDQLDIAGARKWLTASKELTTGDSRPRTLTSRDHILDRLELAEERLEALAARVDIRISTARSFGQTRGRYAELALAAAVLSGIGRTLETEQLLPEILHAASKLSGRFAADHILDLCLRAAEGTSMRNQAYAVAERHLTLRRAGRVGSLPGICVYLRDLEIRLS